jgi:flagellar assembly factor FliW
MTNPVPAFGPQEKAGPERIHFPGGILGFEDYHDYELCPVVEGSPFYWLHCHEEPGLSFAIAPPELFHQGEYRVPLSAEDRRTLELAEGDQPAVFVIVNVSPETGMVTANLKGPLVFNWKRRLGKQVVIYNPSLSLRAPLLRPLPQVVTPSRKGA